MAEAKLITTLFLDIGGVLLTNGWDRNGRENAIKIFQLDPDEVNERHHLIFDSYEEGMLSLDDYLDRVIFYQKRSFIKDEFKAFMLSQSQPYLDTIQFIRELKGQFGLKTVVVSNEGRELTEYRIQAFKLQEFIDSFVCSCFVHRRKPDTDIFRIALDISQSRPENVAYIEDRGLFVEVANSMGINGILHKSLESTRVALTEMGLTLPAKVYSV